MTIKFSAIINGVKVDREGECVISLSVPKSDSAQAIALGVLTERVLVVHISEENEVFNASDPIRGAGRTSSKGKSKSIL